jgi:hypothetical protein
MMHRMNVVKMQAYLRSQNLFSSWVALLCKIGVEREMCYKILKRHLDRRGTTNRVHKSQKSVWLTQKHFLSVD